MSSLRTYRVLPAAAGAWFLVVALLGRLPQAMSQIGVLLLITSTTGSLAAGGAAAATLALGQASGGPVVGRIADQHGHRMVGLATAVLQVVTLCVLVAVAASAAPVGLVVRRGVPRRRDRTAGGCAGAGPMGRQWSTMAGCPPRRSAPR